MVNDFDVLPWYRTCLVLAWLAFIVFFVLVFTDLPEYIAYVSDERDWRFIAWLFSRAYPHDL